MQTMRLLKWIFGLDDGRSRLRPRVGGWKYAGWFNGRAVDFQSGRFWIAWDHKARTVHVTRGDGLDVDTKVYRGEQAELIQQALGDLLDDHGTPATACLRSC